MFDMLSRLLLLLLPTLAHCGILIDIKAGKEGKVEALGCIIALISDSERDAWRLNDEQLKDAIRAFSGKRPDNAYLKSPTPPWKDLYSDYYGLNNVKVSQVKKVLCPSNAEVIGIKSQPVIVASQNFDNDSNVTATYKAEIKQEVTETVSNSWSKGGELEIGQEIEYKIAGVGGTTSISYTGSWGEETSKSLSVTVGSSSGVEVTLKPGQSVTAALTATRGIMEVQVDYRATLNGYVTGSEGGMNWAYEINACLRAAGSQTTIDSREKLKISFYSDAKVTVTDNIRVSSIGSAGLRCAPGLKFFILTISLFLFWR